LLGAAAKPEQIAGTQRSLFAIVPEEFEAHCMKRYTAIVGRDHDMELCVEYMPGLAGARTQAETLDELNRHLREVIALLLEDLEPAVDAEFVGIQIVQVG
jgi:predicted RNase H-like HicB family nuclease